MYVFVYEVEQRTLLCIFFITVIFWSLLRVIWSKKIHPEKCKVLTSKTDREIFKLKEKLNKNNIISTLKKEIDKKNREINNLKDNFRRRANNEKENIIIDQKIRKVKEYIKMFEKRELFLNRLLNLAMYNNEFTQHEKSQFSQLKADAIKQFEECSSKINAVINSKKEDQSMQTFHESIEMFAQTSFSDENDELIERYQLRQVDLTNKLDESVRMTLALQENITKLEKENEEISMMLYENQLNFAEEKKEMIRIIESLRQQRELLTCEVKHNENKLIEGENNERELKKRKESLEEREMAITKSENRLKLEEERLTHKDQKIQKYLDHMHKEIDDRDRQMKDTEQVLRHNETRLEDMEKRKDMLERDLEDYKNKCIRVQKENVDLRDICIEKEYLLQTLEDKIERMEDDKLEAERQNDHLKNYLQAIETKCLGLKSKVDKLKRECTIPAHKNIENELMGYKEKYSRLQMKLQNGEDLQLEKGNFIQILESKVEQMKNDKLPVEQQKDNLENSLKATDVRCKDLKNEVERLKSEWKILAYKDIAEKEEKLFCLEKKLKDLKMIVDLSKVKLNDFNEEYSQVLIQLKNKKDLHKEKDFYILVLEITLKERENEKLEMEEQTAHLKNSLKETEAKCEDLMAEIKKIILCLAKRLEDMKNRADFFKTVLRGCKEEYSQEQKKLKYEKDLHRKKDDIIKVLENKVEQMENEKLKIEQEKNHLKNNLEATEVKVDKLKSECTFLKNKDTAEKVNLFRMEGKLNESEKKDELLETELKEYKEKYSRLQMQLTKERDLLKEKEHLLHVLENKAKHIEDNTLQFKHESDHTTCCLKSTKGKLESIKAEIEQLKSKYKIDDKEAVDITNRIEGLTKNLKEIDLELCIHRLMRSKLEEKNREYQIENIALSGQKNELDGGTSGVKKINGDLEHHLESILEGRNSLAESLGENVLRKGTLEKGNENVAMSSREREILIMNRELEMELTQSRKETEDAVRRCKFMERILDNHRKRFKALYERHNDFMDQV